MKSWKKQDLHANHVLIVRLRSHLRTAELGDNRNRNR